MSERLFTCSIGIILALITASGCDRAKPESANSAQPDSTASPRKSATQNAAIEPDKIEASLKAADQYFSTGELDKARAILEVLVDRAPREGRARELYGQVLALQALQAGPEMEAFEKQKLLETAYEQYLIACDISPESPGLQHSAGMIANAAGRSTHTDSNTDLEIHFKKTPKCDSDTLHLADNIGDRGDDQAVNCHQAGGFGVIAITNKLGNCELAEFAQIRCQQ